MRHNKQLPGACRYVLILLLTGLMSASPTSEPTPQSTVLRFFAAIRAEDRKSLDRLFAIPSADEEARAWLPLVLDSVIARQKLHRLSLARFGAILPATDEIGGNIFISDRTLEEAKRMMDQATVEIDDGVAKIKCDWTDLGRLTSTRPATRAASAPLVLKKIDGEWKIDVGAMLVMSKSEDASREELQTRRRQQGVFRGQFKRLTAAWEDIAAEIEAGKFNSADDANAALKSKE